jgi:hypothetical protein
MNDSLAARAEILKLARLLQRDPATLEYLQVVPPDDIRALREQVTDVLFTAHGQALARLATASRLLPIGLVATIGERAFGPILAARITGLLDPSRAVEMAARMPVSFLADVAIELDPRRASGVISRIPAERVAEITAELVRRGEHVTMGRFVGHLAPDAVVAAAEVMDDQALLHVAFVLESKDSICMLVGVLAPERLKGIARAAEGAGLWAEALDLLAHLDPEGQARFVSVLGPGERRRLVERARQVGMMDRLGGLRQALAA